LDTVYPPSVSHTDVDAAPAAATPPWREEHDASSGSSWLVGPGTMDIKGGTFMLGAVLHALRVVHPQVYNVLDWHVLLNASEEVLADDFVRVCSAAIDAGGAQHNNSQPGNEERSGLVDDAAECLACLVFETGGFRRFVQFTGSDGSAAHQQHQHQLQHQHSLVTSRKGMCVWEVSFTGRAAHAGNAHATGPSGGAGAGAGVVLVVVMVVVLVVLVVLVVVVAVVVATAVVAVVVAAVMVATVVVLMWRWRWGCPLHPRIARMPWGCAMRMRKCVGIDPRA
jgi:hypothetical protein